jgi:hypothetical protein
MEEVLTTKASRHQGRQEKNLPFAFLVPWCLGGEKSFYTAAA